MNRLLTLASCGVLTLSAGIVQAQELEEIVVTAQKRQPRVHTLPSNITVAVPSRQHSPTFGQWASSQTVCRSRPRSVRLMAW